jgi:hypothetical protein
MQPREMGKLLTAAVIAVGTFALAPRVFVDRLRVVDGQTLFGPMLTRGGPHPHTSLT